MRGGGKSVRLWGGTGGGGGRGICVDAGALWCGVGGVHAWGPVSAGAGGGRRGTRG
jgi:hypothetical protein